MLAWLLLFSATAFAETPLTKLPSPDFVAPSLHDERPLRLSSFNGRVVLLNFWASWCYPCRYEMPHFQALYERFRDTGFEVVAVAAYDKLDDARAFQDRYQFSFHLLFDTDQTATEAFDVDTVPQTFLIDRDGFLVPVPDPRNGKVHLIVTDPTIWELPETAQFIKELLAAPAVAGIKPPRGASNTQQQHAVAGLLTAP